MTDKNKNDQFEKIPELFKPVLEYLKENGFSFLIVAGKDGTCSRYMEGKRRDVISMIVGLMENNVDVEEVIEESLTLHKSNK